MALFAWYARAWWIVVIPGIMIALALVAAAAFIPRKQWAMWFTMIFGWLPSLLGLIAYAVMRYYFGQDPLADGNDFYSTSAQVLPVLILTVVVDVSRGSLLPNSGLVVPVLVVGVGEYVCLDILAFGSSGDAQSAAMVAGAYTVGLASLLLSLISGATASASHTLDAESSTSEEGAATDPTAQI